jgi:uncharacterized protein YwqG
VLQVLKKEFKILKYKEATNNLRLITVELGLIQGETERVMRNKWSWVFLTLFCLAILISYFPGKIAKLNTPSVVLEPDGLPRAMAPYRDIIRLSALPYNAVSAQRIPSKPWESKFLGHPYLPKDFAYPRDRDGVTMRLLAQLNFAEMPPLPGYPKSGIVQFYISPQIRTNVVFGSLNEDVKSSEERFLQMLNQAYFRVVYHENISTDTAQLQQNAPFLIDNEQIVLPISTEARLSFSPEIGYVLADDYRFPRFFGQKSFDFYDKVAGDNPSSDFQYALREAYFKFAHKNPVAWVGGYAWFVQDDPRQIRPNEDWLLLLEIRSASASEGAEILWGDAGIGCFFIKRDDLLRRDFSKVLYYWDNH